MPSSTSSRPSSDELLARFRAPDAVKHLVDAIHANNSGNDVRLMHVCGTHENSICQFGLRDLLPSWVKLIAGPGCPVCVCPAADIDMAVRLVESKKAIVTTFGDVVRVPARLTLLEARARGGDCRIVYGIDDAISIASANPEKEVVFFAVGFETTACTTAAAIYRGVPDNFSILCSHRIVPPALEKLSSMEAGAGEAIDGFILPGHVLAVAGLADYEALAAKHNMPMAVAGFEPVDLLLAIRFLTANASASKSNAAPLSPLLFNGYSRLVKNDGNQVARQTISEIFETVDAGWRGIGTIASSGLSLKKQYSSVDARIRFGIDPDPSIPDVHKGCRCGEVLLGRLEPEQCPLFRVACGPENPIGPCMVAFEGTCHARFRHGLRPK